MNEAPLDAIGVALRVGRALDQIGVAYFLGGSLASSLQGDPRSTNDIDFVVEMGAWKVAPLVAALGPDFSVDDVALRDAMMRGGSANLFFLPLVMKIDLFARGASAFDEAEFGRRRRIEIGSQAEAIWIKSPEDSVLRKLAWYLAGGEVSERQWRDVVAICRVGGASLDWIYLRHWAGVLRVSELLERAEREALRASGGGR